MSLDTWVMVGKWDFLDQRTPHAFLDQMQDAGVRNVALGGTLPLLPDPAHYQESEIPPEPPPAAVMDYAARVETLFQEAESRGIGVWVYGTNPHANRLSHLYQRLPQKHWLTPDLTIQPVQSYWGACASGDPFIPYYLARARDAFARFPSMRGILNDGPEFGYEIAPGFMGGNWDLFTCFGPCCAARAQAMGVDWNGILATARTLRHRLRSLDEATLRAAIASQADSPASPTNPAATERTAIDVLAALVGMPALPEWFQFKTAVAEWHIARLCAGVNTISPTLAVGVGSRTAAFAPLTGYDLRRISRHADFVLPKLYMWMGGYDGLYGSVYRWADLLCQWNPTLSPALVMQAVFALFGFALPEVATHTDMERYIDPAHLHSGADVPGGDPFPDEFFATVAVSETQKMIHRTGDASRVRPWTGISHGGRIMTAHELDQMVAAGERGGLVTYLHYSGIDGDVWEVARRHAAQPD